MSAEKRRQNWILVIVVLILAVSVPIYKVYLGEPAVKQGIDLVGGVDLLLQAQVPEGEEKLTSDMLDGAIDILRNRLDPEGVKEIILQKMGDDRIVVQIPGEDDPERVKGMIGETASLKFIDAGNDPIQAGTRIRYLDPETGEPVDVSALTETREEVETPEPEEALTVSYVMQDHVNISSDSLIGLSIPPAEPTDINSEIQPDTTPGGIIVEVAAIPAGLELGAKTSQNIGGYLVLTLDDIVIAQHEITEGITDNKVLFPDLGNEPDFDLAEFSGSINQMKIVGFDAPPPALGTKIEVFDPMGQDAEAEPEETTDALWIDITMDKVILTGDDFADAEVTFDQLGQPIIRFEFKDSGRTIFGRFTAQHVQQFLAIALDDKIISCPIIREPILNGRGIIQGSFTPLEAQDLVVKLDSGRLPVKLEVIENRTVGPTLGQKSIDDSKSAALLGAALILLFMALYYRLPGLLADIALIYYVAVFFGALSVLNATLTLPGIAGFILSIGMAVDANVIIFERLKEELKTGKTFRSATDTAFKRAFLAIFDANVTTLITALVLYNLGTGPIRGFAVTLSLGILVSMFSALVFTRVLVETALNYKTLQKYPMFGIREKDVATFSSGGDAK
jgi:preprotein translocase subunit SecD